MLGDKGCCKVRGGGRRGRREVGVDVRLNANTPSNALARNDNDVVKDRPESWRHRYVDGRTAHGAASAAQLTRDD